MDKEMKYLKCDNCGGVFQLMIFNKYTLEESGFCYSCGERYSYIINRDDDGKIIYNGDQPSIREDYSKKGNGVVFYKESIKGEGLNSIGFYAFSREVSHFDAYRAIASIEEEGKKVIYCNIFYKDEIITIYGKRPSFFYDDIETHILLLGPNVLIDGMYREDIVKLYKEKYNPFAKTERYNMKHASSHKRAQMQQAHQMVLSSELDSLRSGKHAYSHNPFGHDNTGFNFDDTDHNAGHICLHGDSCDPNENK